jgi:hypothetical protein
VHASLFDTNYPGLTRRNPVTHPDIGLHVAKARRAIARQRWA